MRPEVYVARIERLERDNAVLKEALRAFVLNATFSMHEIGARCATGEYGDGEQRDFDLGIRFCRRGAMLGDMECQWDYAMMLYSGEHHAAGQTPGALLVPESRGKPCGQIGTPERLARCVRSRRTRALRRGTRFCRNGMKAPLPHAGRKHRQWTCKAST